MLIAPKSISKFLSTPTNVQKVFHFTWQIDSKNTYKEQKSQDNFKVSRVCPCLASCRANVIKMAWCGGMDRNTDQWDKPANPETYTEDFYSCTNMETSYLPGVALQIYIKKMG